MMKSIDFTNDKVHNKVIHYFAIASVATLAMYLLSLPGVDSVFEGFVAKDAVIIFKLVLFFGIVYLADRFIENWRNTYFLTLTLEYI